jgi:hypothetical protein
MADVPAIEAMLRAAGFQVFRNAATLSAHGSGFECVIDVVPAAAIGLRRVEFVLSGASSRSPSKSSATPH